MLDQLGALDYAELVQRAVVHAESAAGRAALRARFDLVVVDEYQDTDPAQERLLQAIAGDGRDLVVVGDPDQSIYSFRGAEVARPARVPRPGSPAAPAISPPCRRAPRCRAGPGPTLLAASRAVARRMPLVGGGLTQHAAAHHRARSRPRAPSTGQVERVDLPVAPAAAGRASPTCCAAPTSTTGLPWSSMAVLVRSGTRSLPYLRRVLGAAGVPVEAAGDELPLAREPAVPPLLLALRVVADPAAAHPGGGRGPAR